MPEVSGYIIACPVLFVTLPVFAGVVGNSNKYRAVIGKALAELREYRIQIGHMLEYMPERDDIYIYLR